MTTLNIPAPAKPESPRQAQWKEARSVFPIYLALAKQLEIEIPFSQAKRNLPEKPNRDLFSQVSQWLDRSSRGRKVQSTGPAESRSYLGRCCSSLVYADDAR